MIRFVKDVKYYFIVMVNSFSAFFDTWFSELNLNEEKIRDWISESKNSWMNLKLMNEIEVCISLDLIEFVEKRFHWRHINRRSWYVKKASNAAARQWDIEKKASVARCAKKIDRNGKIPHEMRIIIRWVGIFLLTMCVLVHNCDEIRNKWRKRRCNITV